MKALANDLFNLSKTVQVRKISTPRFSEPALYGYSVNLFRLHRLKWRTTFQGVFQPFQHPAIDSVKENWRAFRHSHFFTMVALWMGRWRDCVQVFLEQDMLVKTALQLIYCSIESSRHFVLVIAKLSFTVTRTINISMLVSTRIQFVRIVL